MLIHTLTIDGLEGPVKTMAFATEAEVYERLRQEYEEFAEMTDGDLIEELTERQSVCLYIDTHEVHVPEDPTVYRIDFSPTAIDEHFEMDGEENREPESAGGIWEKLTPEQKAEAGESALGFFEADGLWDAFHDAICEGIWAYAREQLS